MLFSLGLFLLWNGSAVNSLDSKCLHLYFSVSKCTYGIKAPLDSIAFEIEKPLIKEWNIKLGRGYKNRLTKIYKAGDFRIQVFMRLKDPLDIRIFEGKQELFHFKQRKSSSVKYIFYDKNSNPYLIETILTSAQSARGGGISRPPILRKELD